MSAQLKRLGNDAEQRPTDVIEPCLLWVMHQAIGCDVHRFTPRDNRTSKERSASEEGPEGDKDMY